jgi:uncharacterized damage-inducible protein DinB
MKLSETIKILTKYKAWANELTFSSVHELPEGEATKRRQTRFGNMVHTLNHAYVIDDVFKAHILGNTHNYTARNTESHPPLEELWGLQRVMDKWYVDYAKTLSDERLSEVVKFQFIGGGDGVMSRADMIIHVVNHSTYHRGFVGDLMYQVPAIPPANDYPVYLREIDENA